MRFQLGAAIVALSAILVVGVSYPGVWADIVSGGQKKLEKRMLAEHVKADGPISELGFYGLRAGQFYRLSGMFRVSTADGDAANEPVRIRVRNGKRVLGEVTVSDPAGDGTTVTSWLNKPFRAEASTLTFEARNVEGSAYLVGGQKDGGTHVILEQAPQYERTSKWSP
jgi:hypothetical protein